MDPDALDRTRKVISCNCGNCPGVDEDQNCPTSSCQDDLPVQCVDTWAEDKFSYFDRYLSASWGARIKYAEKGNAVYIDLYSGPGISRIKNKNKEIYGGALRAAKVPKAPFNKIILNDLSAKNCATIKSRIPDAEVYSRDANDVVNDIIDKLILTDYKLHFCFVDPFAPKHLNFRTLTALARLQKIDVMINLPIGPIRRSYKTWLRTGGGKILDDLLGTDEWRERLRKSPEADFCNVLLDIFYKQLVLIGFSPTGLGILDEAGNEYKGPNIATIKNSTNTSLYFLILASKNPLAAKLWKSIVNTSAKGQKNLFS